MMTTFLASTTRGVLRFQTRKELLSLSLNPLKIPFQDLYPCFVGFLILDVNEGHGSNEFEAG